MAKGKVVKVTVDHELCVGSSMCLGIDPKRFELNESDQAVFVGDTIDQDLAREAAEVCPVGAITLVVEEA